MTPFGGSSELWSVLMIANPKRARNIRLLLLTGVVELVRGRSADRARIAQPFVCMIQVSLSDCPLRVVLDAHIFLDNFCLLLEYISVPIRRARYGRGACQSSYLRGMRSNVLLHEFTWRSLPLVTPVCGFLLLPEAVRVRRTLGSSPVQRLVTQAGNGGASGRLCARLAVQSTPTLLTVPPLPYPISFSV